MVPPTGRGQSTSPVIKQDNSGYDSLGSSPESSSSSDTSPPPKCEDRHRRGNKLLNAKAVDIMEEWYSANWNHPYPSMEVTESLAERGGITVTQVKKWMANKRVRSYNTLSYNGSIHPRKLKRLQRQQTAIAASVTHFQQVAPLCIWEHQNVSQ